MSFARSTGTSYFEHLQTLSAIRNAGRSVEATLQTGMMRLATAQGAAMRKLGTRINDHLMQGCRAGSLSSV